MPDTHRNDHHPWPVFLVFLRLGLTSFGGPVAHLGYFHNEFVVRRGWLSERSYADLIALCQFLPGPASSQAGIALGLSRAGYAGALAAWLGFALPSALAMILFAQGLASYGDAIAPGILHGLKVAAVAVIAQAIWSMGRKLCPDRPRITIMTIATCIALLAPSVWGQIGAIVMAGLAGSMLSKPAPVSAHDPLPIPVNPRAALGWLALFIILLAGLPIVAQLAPSQSMRLMDACYRTGSLVFGGGHVILPLLQAEVMPMGWISNASFLAGYGAAQAVPGPLLTFAAFLGASMPGESGGWLGGIIALIAIFTPSFLLVTGALPFWERMRHQARMQAILAGINAAVVGLLLAALYQPAWIHAIYQPQDFGLALVALMALVFWKLPPWLVVLGSSTAGWLLATLT